jgi:multidrug efflux pump subunit AcrB
MIWIIALAWIVVWNAIILIEYINILQTRWLTLKWALLEAGYMRFKPIILTSLTTIFWAATIVSDPVWAGLARAIICGLFISSIMTLIVIPIFFYDSQRKIWK